MQCSALIASLCVCVYTGSVGFGALGRFLTFINGFNFFTYLLKRLVVLAGTPTFKTLFVVDAVRTGHGSTSQLYSSEMMSDRTSRNI